MRVFLAGIIQGSLAEARIHDQDWRTPIKRVLAEYVGDAEVYCHYSLHPNSITYELPDIQTTLADGFKQAADCDLLIAYVPSASMGTAIEIYEAARNNAIVLTISPMAPNWVLRAYSHKIFPDVEAFEQFIATGGLAELIEKGK
jgi:hypothetical protein